MWYQFVDREPTWRKTEKQIDTVVTSHISLNLLRQIETYLNVISCVALMARCLDKVDLVCAYES